MKKSITDAPYGRELLFNVKATRLVAIPITSLTAGLVFRDYRKASAWRQSARLSVRQQRQPALAGVPFRSHPRRTLLSEIARRTRQNKRPENIRTFYAQ
jgi:hypothetical protein